MSETPTNIGEQQAINGYEDLKDQDILADIRTSEINLQNSTVINGLKTPEQVNNFLNIYMLESDEKLLDQNKVAERATWHQFQRDKVKIQSSFEHLQSLGDDAARLQWIISSFSSISKIGAMRGEDGGNRVVMSLQKEGENYTILALALNKDGKSFGNGIKIDILKLQK